MSDDKNIDFVARHYRKGSFSTDKGLKAIGFGAVGRWNRLKVAAAVAVIVVLSASAVLIYNRYVPSQTDLTSEESEVVQQSLSEAVRIIDFEDTPLPDVVDRIKDVYGVEIENLPVDADRYTLSLRYEGTADDLVETINDILGTEMIIIWP